MTPNPKPRTLVPGTDVPLEVVRDDEGRLLSMRAAGRTYVLRREHELVFDDELLVTREAPLGRGALRYARSPSDRWVEHYRLDAKGRVAEIDGTRVQRDEAGRVVACLDEQACFRYTYEGDHLVAVEGPSGRRRIERGDRGRPEAVWHAGRTTRLRYDEDGVRLGLAPVPSRWTRDHYGRLWTVRTDDGAVRHVFLWDGMTCLGRVDGGLGGPLAAAFLCDASGTPLRIITRDRVVRVPRDAFGEGLLAFEGVAPGLFGGATHDGQVHYRARRLDPRIGHYDRADPWHGGPSDPRRGRGFRGPLPVDDAAPYAVCRQDPVSRADPTGEISAWVGISSFTWSLQNHLFAFFLLDWWANLLGSLFASIGDSEVLARFVESDFYTAKHSGVGAFRRSGILSPVGEVWTAGSIMFGARDKFEQLARAHAFAPAEQDPALVRRPDYFGTLLVLEPQHRHDGQPLDEILVSKSGNLCFAGAQWATGSPFPSATPRLWTRAGGRAIPLFPGSRVPTFPAGAIHFDPRGGNLSDGGSKRARVDGNVAVGAVSLDLRSDRLDGTVLAGDAFRVGDDPQRYVATAKLSANGNRVANLPFQPPAEREWEDGDVVLFENRWDVPAPQDARLVEAAPQDKIWQGEALRQASLTIGRVGLGVAAGDRFWVETSRRQYVLEVEAVNEEPGETRLRLSGPEVERVVSGEAKLEGVDAPRAPPDVTENADRRLLDVPAPPPPSTYAPQDALRLSWGGNQRVLRVERLEARIRVDEAFGDSLADNATAHHYTPIGAPRNAQRLADPNQISFRLNPGDPVANQPAVGDYLRLAQGGNERSVRVTARIADHGVEVDRSAAPLAPNPNDPLTVRRLDLRRQIGRAARTPPDDTLTLEPPNAGDTPDDDTVVVHSGTDRIVRDIQAKVYDAIRLAEDAPAGVAGTIYSVERFAKRNSNADGDERTIEPSWYLSRGGGSPVDAGAVALAVYGFPSPFGAPTHGRVGFAGTVAAAAGTITVTQTPAAAGQQAPFRGQPVRVTQGTSQATGVVQSVQVELTLDRSVPGATANDLSLAPLETTGPEYEGEAVSATQVRLKPEARTGGGTTAVPFPRFEPGQMLLVDGLVVQVDTADGLVLDLHRGPALAGPHPRAVPVQRLDVAAHPSGTPFAMQGAQPDGARTTLTGDVPTLDAVAVNARVAVVEPFDPARPGAPRDAYPAVVASVDGAVVVVRSTDPMTAGNGRIEFFDDDFTLYVARFTRDGADFVLPEGEAAFGGDRWAALVVGYDPTGTAWDGALSPGCVKVPDRLDDASDLTRFEALVEHEVQHSVQSAQFGPLLLQLFPTFLFELTVDLATEREREDFEEGWDGLSQALEFLSLGGLMNVLVGTTYAGVLWLLALAFHGVKELIAWGGDTDLDGIDLFEIDFRPGRVLEAGDGVTRIQMAPDAGLDVAAGGRVQVRARGGGTLFAFADRHTVREVIDEAAGRIIVVEATDLPTNDANEIDVAASNPGLDTPIHRADDYLLRSLGMGWLSVLFDPYGQAHERAEVSRDSPEGITLRVLRYLFGSRSWTLVPLGFAFWDNLRRQWGSRLGTGGQPFLALMEKWASWASGDTYFRMGQLLTDGVAESALVEHQRVHVGDVVRYWHTRDGADRASGTLVKQGQGDLVGVHLERGPCLMPHVDPTAENPASPDVPNRGANIQPPAAGIVAAGLAVPDDLVVKETPDPTDPTTVARSHDRLWPSALASVPTRPDLERTMGIYAAFTSPATAATNRHRVTCADGTGGMAEARIAMDEGQTPLVHDLEVQDVTVRLGGHTLARGGALQLVPFQRAELVVEPGAPRRYDLLVTQPTAGDVRRVTLAGGQVALTSPTGNPHPAEPVEIARVYERNGAGGFGAGPLAAHGLHVLDRLWIPVRTGTAEVVTDLSFRADPEPDAAAAPDARAGEALHLLVPAPVRASAPGAQNPTTQVAYVAPAPAHARPPAFAPRVQAVDADTPEATQEMLRHGGRHYVFEFPEDDPPEKEATVDVEVVVERGGVQATLSAQLTLRPHFTLGGPAFDVQAGGAPIVLTCSGGVQAGQTRADPDEGVNLAVAGGDVTITVAAGTPPRIIDVLVQDAAQPTHWARARIEVTA